jgi:outer membrane protein TolC
MVKLLALLLSTTVSATAFAAPAKKAAPKATPAVIPTAAPVVSNRKVITLTQKQVAELVLQQGLKTKEVNLKYQTYRLAPVQTLSLYDWQLYASTGFEKDKTVGLLATGTVETQSEYERYRTTLGFRKPFTTGTLLGLELSRISQQVDLDASITNPPPTEQTLDTALLTLEQSLLGNFFGRSDRAVVEAADLNYQANEILRANELEDVVLEVIRQFWATYVSEENFKETVAARDRYKTLVDAVRRKTNLGYSTPGDLPQIQAEFEGREQSVKMASTDYLKDVDTLITLLSLEPGTEIKFNVPSEIPPVPKLAPKDPDKLRLVRSQKLKTQAAAATLRSSESLSYPTLNFVGQLKSTGRDENAEGSYSELTAGNRPYYYMGLRFAYNFGSDVQNELIINSKLNKDLEETRLSRQLLEVNDLESQAERKAQAAYAVALSAEKQKGFRDKAARELQKTYNQGRTDISILITALNNFFNSEVVYQQALGSYHTALNEWAALRDELISDDRAVDVEVK